MQSFRPLTLSALALWLVALPAQAQNNDAYSPATAAASVFETRISDLEAQLRAMTGKVEQLEFANRQMRQQLERQQSDSEMRLSTLEKQASIRANLDASASAQDASEILAGSPPPQAGASAINLNGQRPTQNNLTQSSNDGTPQEQYDRAFSLLRQANYDDAEIAFKAFISNNSEDKLVDNAKYWLAETFYVRSKFQDAAVAFAESYQAAPTGVKAPDSLLKLAMSLSALKNTKDACTTLNELGTKFPNASGSVKNRAEQERQRLKCGQASVAKKKNG